MREDYEIKIKIGKWFFARRFSVAKASINKTKYWFIGKNEDNFYREIIKFNI